MPSPVSLVTYAYPQALLLTADCLENYLSAHSVNPSQLKAYNDGSEYLVLFAKSQARVESRGRKTEVERPNPVAV